MRKLIFITINVIMETKRTIVNYQYLLHTVKDAIRNQFNNPDDKLLSIGYSEPVTYLVNDNTHIINTSKAIETLSNDKNFTVSEKMVLEGIINGMSISEIAEKMGISKGRVCQLRKRVYQKLGYKSEKDMIRQKLIKFLK